MNVVSAVVIIEAPPVSRPIPTYCIEPANIKRLMANDQSTPYPALSMSIPKPIPRIIYPAMTGTDL